ncbi:DUF4304 domain-containing protein [Zhouia sp. PK063]|uniref:DUF4304 domain-containing protein n=1 Tax=Zhouia sp. PK063 TaxID=3373602 RepID=UPI003798B445
MDSKAVNKEINSIIRPILKQNGFDKFSGRTYWRYHSDRIDILNFQSFNSYNADVLGCTTYSFSVNLSVYLTFLPEKTKVKEKDRELRPDESQGHFRSNVKKYLEQPEFPRKDIWFIDSGGKYTQASISDCKNQIQQVGLDWYNKFDTKEKIMKILSEDETEMDGTWGFGNFDSASRNELIAYTAIELGQTDLAVQKLNRLIDFNEKQYEIMKYDYYLAQIGNIKKEIDRIKTTHNKL